MASEPTVRDECPMVGYCPASGSYFTELEPGDDCPIHTHGHGGQLWHLPDCPERDGNTAGEPREIARDGGQRDDGPDDSGDITEAQIADILAGEHMVHRLRDWEDGDTLYGVAHINTENGAASGKTYREASEDAEERARVRFANHGPSLDAPPTVHVSALYRGVVQDVRTERLDPDPGEPPGMFATLTEVEVLNWKQTGEGGEG